MGEVIRAASPPQFTHPCSPSLSFLQIWDATTTALTPLLDETVHLEEEEWAAELEIVVSAWPTLPC
jgi:hypothetical protein